MRAVCCPVCVGKCEVPFGFYGYGSTFSGTATVELTTGETEYQTFGTVQAMPEKCRSCEGNGYLVIE